MSGVNIYRTEVAPEWIDYNGHLRDAYYSLIVSLATDALMDRLGLDEAYRARTRCTLYTLEMHMHFLREVKKTDVVDVAVRILGTDRKRIHAAFDMRCGRYPDPVATAEIMLLHVHQGDEPKAQTFPPEVIEALARIAEEDAAGTVAPGAAGTVTPGAAGTAAAGATGAAAAGAGAAAGAAGTRMAGAVGAAAGVPAREPPQGGAPAPASPIPGSRRMELRSRS
jgi:acyl-CoA thioester hydrolase